MTTRRRRPAQRGWFGIARPQRKRRRKANSGHPIHLRFFERFHTFIPGLKMNISKSGISFTEGIGRLLHVTWGQRSRVSFDPFPGLGLSWWWPLDGAQHPAWGCLGALIGLTYLATVLLLLAVAGVAAVAQAVFGYPNGYLIDGCVALALPGIWLIHRILKRVTINWLESRRG